jgi:hypothetical protein
MNASDNHLKKQSEMPLCLRGVAQGCFDDPYVQEALQGDY